MKAADKNKVMRDFSGGAIDILVATTVIEVGKDDITVSSFGDYEQAQGSKLNVVFYRESDKYTFWYKIVASHTCDVQFDIYPSDESDRYNFFLYKYDGPNFCKGIIDGTVIPFRANLFALSGPGRGLGTSKTVKGERMEAVDNDDYFYYQPRNQVIEVQKGQTYYLNVHHLVGEDCGHAIKFTSCKKSLRIEAKHKPCYEPEAVMDSEAIREALEKLKSITSIASIAATPIEELEIEELPIELSKVEEVEQTSVDAMQRVQIMELKPTVFDARTEKSLHADFAIVELSTGKKIKHHVKDGGRIEADLMPNTDYVFEYSSLGYDPQQIEVRTEGKDHSFSLKPVFLKPKAVGSNIVLNDIYFHPNTHVFRNGADQELERLLNFLKDNVKARVEIQGHTNGDYRVKPQPGYGHLGEEWNYKGSSQKLSKLRAKEVQNFLINNGIDSDRLSSVGLGGKNMIIAYPVDYEDRLVNMRVEIVILEI